MTFLDKIESAPIEPGAAAPASGHHLSLELGETLKLAVPIALTQLGQIAMMTTDIAFIGRLGSEALAAASLAHTVFFVSFTFGMRLVSAVAPLAAQAFGARDPRMVRRSLRVGLVAALWFTARRRPFRKYPVLGRIWRIAWHLMRQLVRVGAPISISFLLEYGLFGAAGLLMGLISTTALAAHQIALQIAAILFMVPFGVGMVATVRVGHAVGRNDAPAVRRAGFVATLLGIVFMSVMTLAVIVGRFAIARFFFGEAADSPGAGIELT